MDKKSLETIELEMAILVRRVTSAKLEKGRNLDRSAYLILHQVFTRGASGVKALADEFQLDVSTVSRQAAVLEQKELLYKVPDPLDGRAYFYEITDQGKRELNIYKEARLTNISKMLKEWTDEEKEHFGHLLQKFNQALSER